jgi:hypothetical protein
MNSKIKKYRREQDGPLFEIGSCICTSISLNSFMLFMILLNFIQCIMYIIYYIMWALTLFNINFFYCVYINTCISDCYICNINVDTTSKEVLPKCFLDYVEKLDCTNPRDCDHSFKYDYSMFEQITSYYLLFYLVQVLILIYNCTLGFTYVRLFFKKPTFKAIYYSSEMYLKQREEMELNFQIWSLGLRR